MRKDHGGLRNKARLSHGPRHPLAGQQDCSHCLATRRPHAVCLTGRGDGIAEDFPLFIPWGFEFSSRFRAPTKQPTSLSACCLTTTENDFRRRNLTRLVLCCTEAKFCKKIRVGKLSPRSTQCTPLHRSLISIFSSKIANFF